MARQYQTVLLIIMTVLLALQCQKTGSSDEIIDTAAAIQWSTDLGIGLQQSQKQSKPLMVEFTANWCPYCKMLEDSTFSHKSVIEKSLQFIPVQIDVDKQPEVADQYQANARKYGGSGIPNVLFMNPEGKKLHHITGYQDHESFLSAMDSALTLHRTQ